MFFPLELGLIQFFPPFWRDPSSSICFSLCSDLLLLPSPCALLAQGSQPGPHSSDRIIPDFLTEAEPGKSSCNDYGAGKS